MIMASLVTNGIGIIAADLGLIENFGFESKSNEISFTMMSMASFLSVVNDNVIWSSAFAT